MSQAVVGLIGVIVGAAITGGFQYYLRRRADRLESRVAARLLSEALLNRHVPTTDDPRLPNVYDFQWIVDEWQEHRAVLARSLTRREWSNVAEAVALATLVSGARPGEVSPSGEKAEVYGGTISQVEAAMLDELERNLHLALLEIQRAAFGRREARGAKSDAMKLGLLDDLAAKRLGLPTGKPESERYF